MSDSEIVNLHRINENLSVCIRVLVGPPELWDRIKARLTMDPRATESIPTYTERALTTLS